MAQDSSSHGSFGEHGSATEDTNSKAHNKRNPTEQSRWEESHHKRFRGTQDWSQVLCSTTLASPMFSLLVIHLPFSFFPQDK